VQLLVDELGANANVTDRWFGTPLDDAIRSEHEAVAAFLQSKGATRGHTANIDPSAALCGAAASGDIDKLRLLVSKGVSIDHGDYDKRTALHLAASEGLLQVVQVLVDELGATLSPVDRWRGTPLDDAIRAQSGEVAKFLRSRGAALGADESFQKKRRPSRDGDRSPGVLRPAPEPAQAAADGCRDATHRFPD